jgi:hypothetical protein
LDKKDGSNNSKYLMKLNTNGHIVKNNTGVLLCRGVCIFLQCTWVQIVGYISIQNELLIIKSMDLKSE